MQQIILIFTCLVVGVVLRLSGRLPDNATKVLGGFVINVALPAAALRSVHELALHPDWWLAAATPWLGALLALIVLWITISNQTSSPCSSALACPYRC